MTKQFIKIKIIFLFVLVIIINSCKKYEDAYIKGQVIEKGSGTAIAGLPIVLMHGYKDNNGAHKWETIITTTSDQDGFYKIEFHRELFNDYTITWKYELPDYLPSYDDYAIHHFKTARTISLIPAGHVIIRVKKTGYSGSFIRLYTASPDKFNLPVINNNSPFDTIFQHVFKMPSGVQTNIIWDYYPNANSDYTRHTDYITINKGDTITHIIEFD